MLSKWIKCNTFANLEKLFKDKRDKEITKLKAVYEAFIDVCVLQKVSPEDMLEWSKIHVILPQMGKHLGQETIDRKNI